MALSCDCCVLSGTGLLRRADQASRGVLPNMVRRYVCSRILLNDEAVARVGTQRKKNLPVSISDECYVFQCAACW